MGESLSSVIPSTMAFIQGVAKNINTCKNDTVVDLLANKSFATNKSDPNFSASTFFALIFVFMLMSLISFIFVNRNFSKYKKTSKKRSDKSNLKESETFFENTNNSNHIRLKKSILMLLAFLVSFFMYGILPTIASYSTLPYSHRAFNLSINLGKN